MPTFWQSAPFVIVAVLLICDFLWTDATPSTAQTNVWISRQNSSTVNTNAIWQTTSTPWPALGARKPYGQHLSGNSPGIGNNQNQNSNMGSTHNKNTNSDYNKNVGVDLSYGANGASNTNNKNIKQGVSSGNIGYDLSYGLISNQNNVAANRGEGTLSSTQRLNSAQSGKPYSQVAQNTNNQDNLKTSQNTRIPILRPVSQTANSQSSIANMNNVHQRNTLTGTMFQNGSSNTPAIDEDEELRQFSETLLRKDTNNVGKYVTINYQGKTTSRSLKDEAPLPLLTIQKDAYNIPSIANLLALHNNYILETNVNEHVSAQEKMEENDLLDTLLSTSVMQHTRNFLIQKGVIPRDPKFFKDKLKEMWFNMYSRGKGKIGSSGFEHVFLAELKNQDVSGLHNWIYFHDAEEKNDVNYLGYLKKFELSNNKGAILKYHFNLKGKDKPVGSMFIGTSPELEVALYSTCFLLRPDHVCPLRFDGKNFIIRTYTFRYRGKNMIGSAFPEI